MTRMSVRPKSAASASAILQRFEMPPVSRKITGILAVDLGGSGAHRRIRAERRNRRDAAGEMVAGGARDDFLRLQMRVERLQRFRFMRNSTLPSRGSGFASIERLLEGARAPTRR